MALPVRVLVVEDDPDTRECLAEALRVLFRFEVTVAPDAATATEVLQQGLPDVLVVEVHGTGGRGLVLDIRADPKMVRLGIVVLTGMVLPETDVLRALGRVHLKPVDLDVLAEDIRRLADTAPGT